jgi:putative ABC transport system permease protein
LLVALLAGGLAGVLTATIQRGSRIDPLLAGVLATFILSSLNLIIMGKPNISLLLQPTFLTLFASDGYQYTLTLVSYALIMIMLAFTLLQSRFGLLLRAFGDNPHLLMRLGKNIENYRLLGFALTNMLAAGSGILTAQTVGYADIGMGFGMTLTGIGTIILGQQIFSRFMSRGLLRAGMEFLACLLGVVLYFISLNLLLQLDIDPLYLKMILGFVLILFLRSAVKPAQKGVTR